MHTSIAAPSTVAVSSSEKSSFQATGIASTSTNVTFSTSNGNGEILESVRVMGLRVTILFIFL